MIRHYAEPLKDGPMREHMQRTGVLQASSGPAPRPVLHTEVKRMTVEDAVASLQPTLRWTPIVSSCRRKWLSPPWDTRWLGWAPEASWPIVRIITFPGSLCFCGSRTMPSSCSLASCCYLPACHLTPPHLPGANCGLVSASHSASINFLAILIFQAP